MDELDLFREFRSDVAPPSADARRRGADALGGEWAPRVNVLRYGALALAALVAATAAALFLSTPWNDSSGFLERAEAALTGDPDTVLHARWQVTTISTDPACTLTGAPNEIWVDQRPPYRYRAIGSFPTEVETEPRELICGGADRATEIGGTLEPGCPSPTKAVCSERTIIFEPPNTLASAPLPYGRPADEAQALVDAIADGRAHDEGETQLDGRTVHRIRMDQDWTEDCPYASCPSEPAYFFVDAETFVPVEMRGHGLLVLPSGAIWFRVVVRYDTYEYLPRTPANLALADIRAQHPDAVER